MVQRKRIFSVMVVALLLLSMTMVLAQDDMVTVPDITGLNLPQATAALNRDGLALGSEDSVQWTADSDLEANTIRFQTIAAGTPVTRGTIINVQVLRTNNTLLLYDDNDLTLINQGPGRLNLSSVTFESVGGSSTATFNASQWAQRLGRGDCGQIWSVARRSPKAVEGCDSTQWNSTTNTARHFWTGSNGATSFRVVQNGIERAQCPIAAQGRCELFLNTGGSSDDSTAFVYFAYTADRLIVSNTSADRWMPLTDVRVTNNNLDSPAVLGISDPDLFGNPRIPGRLDLLAPGQCLLFTNSDPDTGTPPQACDVIARLDINPALIFWGAAFDVDSATDELPHHCPAATADRMTVCIMPR